MHGLCSETQYLPCCLTRWTQTWKQIYFRVNIQILLVQFTNFSKSVITWAAYKVHVVSPKPSTVYDSSLLTDMARIIWTQCVRHTATTSISEDEIPEQNGTKHSRYSRRLLVCISLKQPYGSIICNCAWLYKHVWYCNNYVTNIRLGGQRKEYGSSKYSYHNGKTMLHGKCW
jgi:hypothetical protein